MPAPAPALCPRCGFRPAEALNFCPSCGSDLRGLSGFNDTLAGSHAGRVIADRYRILEKVGEGGMGSVFKVEHVRMGKAMALKLMRPDYNRDEQAVERFVAEARIVSCLTHIHTISVFDFGEADDGSLYIAMEYCPGRDLAWLLRSEGRLPERRAVQIVCQVLRSLAEAHDAGVIHRDVKPGNVMLLRSREGDDFVKVLDFGIAKLAEARPGHTSVTGVGDFVGTPNYMPPEQARGQELTPAADLYATGAMLFELVTGRIPFVAPTPMGIITAHVTEPAPSPREVAPDAAISHLLESVILKALQKDPARRYQSADEMRVDLEGIFTSSGKAFTAADAMSGAMTGDLQIASRGDFVEFEQQLRRDVRVRRFIPLLAVVLLLAGGAAAYTNRARLLAPIERGAQVEGVEVEPNNEPNQANVMKAGVEVTGHMTGRFGGDGDMDTFVVTIPPGDFTADVSLSGIPDINLELDLFDAKGRALAKIDQAPAGQPERITPLGVKDRLYVQVHENVVGRGTPKENTIDGYRLKVDLHPRQPDFEVEPNAEPEWALTLEAGHPVWGIAGAKGGRDAFKAVVPQDATVAGVAVSGVPGVNLALAQPAVEGKPEPSTDERAEGVGELLPLPAGSSVVFVDTAEGVNHEDPYRMFFFTSGEQLLGFVDTLEKAGKALDAAALARRAASRYPRSPVAPELLWATSQIASRAADRLNKEAESTVGFEPDPRRRRDAFMALAPLAAWKEAGVALHYVGSGLVYDNESLRKLVSSYGESPLAEKAQAELIRGEWERCGPAAVADRALAFLARFPRSERAPDALLALGEASEELASGKNARARGDAARAAYHRVTTEFASSPAARTAGERLAALGKTRPPRPFFPCD